MILFSRLKKYILNQADRAYWGGSKSIIGRLLCRRYEKTINRNGSYIGNPAKFKTKPVFPHGINGIFVSGDAAIGDECIIFQQVTIGSNYLPGSRNNGAPTIGDNCYIGAGAKIIGKVRVGNNCRIGANAVVVDDIPDNCTVVLGKCKIIKTDRPINRYYSMLNGQWYEIHTVGNIRMDLDFEKNQNL